MKKLISLVCLSCILIGCNNVEKKAAIKLQAAQDAFEQGNYNEAKTQLDSIKILYPKAFETRRAGNALMYDVELAEQQKTVRYLDSLLQQKEAEFNAYKKRLTLEKDAAYQEIGDYIHPSQIIEKNTNRSFLRFMADETGMLKMTSIYCGAQHIHHNAVKVISPDGSYVQTPRSKDSYETSNLGKKIEKADFKKGNDGGVMEFIYNNRNKALKVSYIGEKPYTTAMSATDRQALTAVYEAALQLSAISEIKKNIEAAQLKITFIEKKKAQKANKAEE